jgi:hypothetical protein
MIATVDGKAFAAVEPRIVEQAGDSSVGDIGPEISPCFVDESDLISLMRRTGRIVIGDTPLSDPAGFATSAIWRPAFRENVFL